MSVGLKGKAGIGSQRAGFAGMTLAVAVSVYDLFGTAAILPSAADALGVAPSAAQALLGLFAIAFAASMLPAGRAGDFYDPKKVFLVGATLYAAGTAALLAVGSLEAALWCRLVQGVGMGVLIPQVFTFVNREMPRERRARAIALISAVNGLAAIVSQLVVSFVLERDVFGLGWAVVPATALVLILFASALLVPSLARPAPVDAAADARGGVAAAALAGLAVLAALAAWATPGLDLAQRAGVCLIALVAAAAWLVGRRSRASGALVDGSVLANRPFLLATAAIGAYSAANGGFFSLLPTFLQQSYGLSPTESARFFSLLATCFVAASLVSGRLYRRFGHRIAQAGLGLIGIGAMSLVLATSATAVPWTGFAAAIAVMGLGMGATAAPLQTFALAGVGETASGSASGLLNATLEIAYAVGIASFGALFWTMADASSGAALRPAFHAVLAAQCGLVLVAFAAVTLAGVARWRAARAGGGIDAI